MSLWCRLHYTCKQFLIASPQKTLKKRQLRRKASKSCHISTLQQISTYLHSKGNKEIVRVSGIRVYVVDDKVQVILYPLPRACCIKRSYDKRGLKYCPGTTTKLFQINTQECHKLRCFMRPCPSFQLVGTRDTSREVTEIRPCTSRPVAQKLSSRLKYNAIYYLGQNETRTANPSFFGNQGRRYAKAKTRHFPIFDLGRETGTKSLVSCPRFQPVNGPSRRERRKDQT